MPGAVNMKKRILFFIGGSYISGLEMISLHLIRGLLEEGYEVRCVINGWNDGNYRRKLEELGIKVHEAKLGWFYLKKPLWTLDSLVHYPKAFLKVRSVIREFKPDICHFCNYGVPLLIYPLIRHKTVYGLHETYQPTAKHRFIFRILDKKIKIFTGVSQHIVRVLEKLGINKNKIRLVYNGIPPINLPAVSSVPGDDRDSRLVFAIIGQIVRWKGHGTLVQAVEKLKAAGNRDFIIQVYGNDTTAYAAEIKNQISEKQLGDFFEWKGFVKDQSLIYKDCEAVIVPSLSEEPCSLSIIESMTIGKGLIVSDRGGNPELVIHEKDGLVFKAGEADQLSACMQQMIGNRQSIATFATNARQDAMQKFTYQAMVNKHIEIYESL